LTVSAANDAAAASPGDAPCAGAGVEGGARFFGARRAPKIEVREPSERAAMLGFCAGSAKPVPRTAAPEPMESRAGAPSAIEG
jgi:hypothetical protein